MGFRDFARSLKPGADQQLAADLTAQQRTRRHHSGTRALRKGQEWEDADRNSERAGRDRITDWDA
ncbi:hypothetical protein ACWEHT_11560 [Streptomyces sp. NPDC004646]